MYEGRKLDIQKYLSHYNIPPSSSIYMFENDIVLRVEGDTFKTVVMVKLNQTIETVLDEVSKKKETVSKEYASIFQ